MALSTKAAFDVDTNADVHLDSAFNLGTESPIKTAVIGKETAGCSTILRSDGSVNHRGSWRGRAAAAARGVRIVIWKDIARAVLEGWSRIRTG